MLNVEFGVDVRRKNTFFAKIHLKISPNKVAKKYSHIHISYIFYEPSVDENMCQIVGYENIFSLFCFLDTPLRQHLDQ